MEDMEHLDEWFNQLRAFASSKYDQKLCRFNEVTRSHTDVQKGFLLKYDPREHPEYVDNLDWEGTPITDIVLRNPILPADISCHVWFLSSTVREATTPPGAYYDDDGDPFDPNNLANWDGDQQKGFRD